MFHRAKRVNTIFFWPFVFRDIFGGSLGKPRWMAGPEHKTSARFGVWRLGGYRWMMSNFGDVEVFLSSQGNPQGFIHWKCVSKKIQAMKDEVLGKFFPVFFGFAGIFTRWVELPSGFYNFFIQKIYWRFHGLKTKNSVFITWDAPTASCRSPTASCRFEASLHLPPTSILRGDLLLKDLKPRLMYPRWNQHSTSKWMVGRCVSFWEGLFSGDVSFLGKVVFFCNGGKSLLKWPNKFRLSLRFGKSIQVWNSYIVCILVSHLRFCQIIMAGQPIPPNVLPSEIRVW